jgi:hypothetical protein
VASSVGLLAVPAGADSNNPNDIHLSYDFSDNSDPASASNGYFNIIVNVLPEHTPGIVRMVAIAPSDADVGNMVCPFQKVQKSFVECAFNFPVGGTWAIRAQYAPFRGADVAASVRTNITVGD